MTTTEDLGIHGIEDLEPLDSEGSDIFRARQSLEDRLVAVKILDPIQEPLVPRRAGLRRKPLAKFGEDSGVVTVHVVGTTPDGQQFLVMPYFRIGSLADQLVHGPMPWHQAAHLIMRCAETVAKAHELEVVLADIKPSSIMLADASSPVLAVYGMATRRFDNGSPMFSAPEVKPGAALTPAADVYSLCLILAALLAGRPPNRGEVGGDLLADVDVLTPDRVLEIARRGLSDHPGDRYRNAADLTAALAAALAADSKAEPPVGVSSTPSTELSSLDLDALLGEEHVDPQPQELLLPLVDHAGPEDPFDFEALLELPTSQTSPADEEELSLEAFDLDDLLGVGRKSASPKPSPPTPEDNTVVLTSTADDTDDQPPPAPEAAPEPEETSGTVGDGVTPDRRVADAVANGHSAPIRPDKTQGVDRADDWPRPTESTTGGPERTPTPDGGDTSNGDRDPGLATIVGALTPGTAEPTLPVHPPVPRGERSPDGSNAESAPSGSSSEQFDAPTSVEPPDESQRPQPPAPPIRHYPVAANPVELAPDDPTAAYPPDVVPEDPTDQTISIWDTPPTPSADPAGDNPTIVVGDATNTLFPPRPEEAPPPPAVYERPMVEPLPEAMAAAEVVAQPTQSLPGPADVDESMPFRTFERQHAYGQHQGRTASLRDSIQSAWFNRRISFTGVLAFLTFAGVAGFAVTLIVQDFRSPTVLPTPTQTVSTIVRAAGPSVVAPTSVPPQLPEPASTHVTQAIRGTALRVTTTVAITLPPTSATTTTNAPATSGSSATTEPTPSSTTGTTAGSSTTERQTTTTRPSTTAPSTTDGTDGDEQALNLQGPTDPLIHEATVSRIRTTTARVSFRSSACVTAVFSYAAADGVATQLSGGARCATDHTLLLGTVTPSLRPGTTYTVVITVSDGTDASRETLSFTTLG